MMLYDISPPIQEGMGVYPGDVPFSFKKKGDQEREEKLPSAVETTLHLGAHVDAPCHCLEGASSIGEMQLHPFLGPCQVMEVSPFKGESIRVEDLREIKAPRILFKTGTFLNPLHFDSYAGLQPQVISYLHQRGVILVGIDTPNIDVIGSLGLPSHHRAFQLEMAVLEGISLVQVPEGCYELLALPLHILGADGSPVRAVLRQL